MGDFNYWLGLALREPVPPETHSEPKFRGSEMTFLASLKAARARVIADGLEVLLFAHDRTIGDDPQFGLPQNKRAA